MMDNETLSVLLDELDGIAKAPMTSSQRESRAGALLAESAITVDEIMRALPRRNLPWNQRKAEELDVSIETWQRAVRIVLQSPGGTLRDLLERLNQSQSVAEMLRAGYCAGRDAYGRLVWTANSDTL
jgi:hypothetical protein